jgi:hypothetical protein
LGGGGGGGHVGGGGFVVTVVVSVTVLARTYYVSRLRIDRSIDVS